MSKVTAVLLTFGCLMVSNMPALAQELAIATPAAPTDFLSHLAQVQVMLGKLWLSIATALVLSMQAGFLLLEAGLVRSKNAINVAQKNLSDFVLASMAFILIGAGLMFGPSFGGWVGTIGSPAGFDSNDGITLAFQLAFCGTAATIVSGAVAERMSFNGYMFVAVLTATLIYPVSGHWIWGQVFDPDNQALLADRGFIDFAGATVVHSLGGWIALAAVILVGPRSGRFDHRGLPNRMMGHSAVLSTTGAAILWVGWLGFNAGAAHPNSPEFGRIILNTIMAASAGGLTGILIGRWLDGSHLPQNAINGIIGGLVSITASCFAVTLNHAMLIGAIGGILAIVGAWWLLRYWRLDDAVGAVAAHGFAGAWGTLAVAIFIADDQLRAGSRTGQLIVQAEGILLVFAFAFGATWVVLSLFNRFVPLRVSVEEETLGLNVVEHCSTLGTGHLTRALDALATKGDALTGVQLDQGTGDEAAELATVLNRLMDRQVGIEERLWNNQKRFKDFAETASDWLWETDSDHKLSYLSEQEDGSQGSEPEPKIGRVFYDFFESVSSAPDPLEELMMEHREFREMICILRQADPKVVHFQLSGRPCFDHDGTFLGYRGTATDITQRLQAESRIQFLADHDSLTGLANRSRFREAFETLVGRTSKHQESIAVLLLDLDDFKGINDTYGHEAGDQVLMTAAQRLNLITQESDLIARLGGDEFAIVMPFKDLDDVTVLCKQIIFAIGEPIEAREQTVHTATSIGVSLYPSDGGDLETLMRHADLALYEAKNRGRGTFVFFTKQMQEALHNRKTLVRDLHQALIDDDLELAFQPQIQLNDNGVSGLEALLRWTHPSQGPLSPDVFVPVAESSGLIQPIGLLALAKSCTAASLWRKSIGRPIKVAVNVSPLQFSQESLLDDITRIVAASELSPECLELEITESMLITDTDRAIAILSALRNLGVSIAVDDFGTGYSSLSYLSRFPLNRLKIDRSFIKNLEASDRDRKIAKAIIQLGDNLGLSIIAEGVETTFQHNYLRDLGCHEAQGFLYSPPKPISEIEAILRQGFIAPPINAANTMIPGLHVDG